MLLEESLRKTSCIIQGYKVGRLVIEENEPPYLEDHETGKIFLISKGDTLEILNDNKWEQVEISDLDRKTEEGWPLLAGFEARIIRR